MTSQRERRPTACLQETLAFFPAPVARTPKGASRSNMARGGGFYALGFVRILWHRPWAWITPRAHQIRIRADHAPSKTVAALGRPWRSYLETSKEPTPLGDGGEPISCGKDGIGALLDPLPGPNAPLVGKRATSPSEVGPSEFNRRMWLIADVGRSGWQSVGDLQVFDKTTSQLT
jgi:hypothetical protein